MPVMKPQLMGRRRWAEESRVFEVVGDYVGVVKMSLGGASVVVGGGKGKVNERFGSAAGAEEAPALAARAAFNAFAKTILLEASITDPIFRQTK